MENNPELEHQIRQLQSELDMLRAKAQKYDGMEREWKELKEKYAEDLFQERQQVQQWRNEARQWLHAYEQLRLQKGGFGFRSLGAAMTASGILGVILCLGVVYIWLHRNDHLAAFKRDHLFQVEYAVSQGRFQEAAGILESAEKDTQYKRASPSIKMMEQVVEAAEKGCAER